MIDPGIDLVLLALLMAAVTYPWRAGPLLAAHFARLPGPALSYLRLVGPAVLAALAAVNTMVAVETTDTGRIASFHVGIEWLAVAACTALVAWRRNLLLGIVTAVVIVAAGRVVATA
jgi:branched-subunit amino acid transport protein